MPQYQSVFRRYEKKYMLSSAQYRAFAQVLSGYMEPDSYGRTTICSLYFDTCDYSLIRASIEKPPYKEKLRIRSYGVPGQADDVFLELKKKYKGVVYKRRAAMPYAQARRFLSEPSTGGGQVLEEVRWFLNWYHPVPRALIAYERVAWQSRNGSELRVTFDQNIRCRETELELSLGTYGEQILEQGDYLMEVKAPGAVPLWMSRALSELEIFPTSFSKYGTYYKQILLQEERGGVFCA